jgi:hypothetical protein
MLQAGTLFLDTLADGKVAELVEKRVFRASHKCFGDERNELCGFLQAKEPSSDRGEDVEAPEWAHFCLLPLTFRGVARQLAPPARFSPLNPTRRDRGSLRNSTSLFFFLFQAANICKLCVFGIDIFL